MRALALVLLLAGCRMPTPAPTPSFVDLCGQRIVDRRLEEAEAACNEGLALTPNDAQLLYNRAVVHVMRGERFLAKQDATASLRSRPGYAPALNLLGVLAIEALDWVTAEERFRAALAADPRYAEARYSLGRVLLKRERPGEAEAEFRTLIAQGVGITDGHLGLARALLLQRRYTEAEASLSLVLEDDPDDADGWQLRGELELAQGHPDQAKRAFERCLALAPERPACRR